jgi:hypothetical protein
VIEAPEKVVLHVRPLVHLTVSAPSQTITLTMTQSRVTCSAHGTTYSTDSARILSFVEEDGELKILQVKLFSDPQVHSAFFAAGEGAPAS